MITESSTPANPDSCDSTLGERHDVLEQMTNTLPFSSKRHPVAWPAPVRPRLDHDAPTGLPSRVGKVLPPHLADLRDKLARQSSVTAAGTLALGDARIDRCLPGGGLPLGQLHEVEATGPDVQAGVLGAAFAAGLLARIAPARAVIWIARRCDLHAPGLLPFGLDPGRLVMVRPPDDAGVLAAMETALREGGIAAVVGEVGKLGRVASRRVHFSCLRHGVTAFALRRFPHGKAAALEREATSVATRWQLSAVPSQSDWREPGAPRWRLELTHARGGRPGGWIVEPTLKDSDDENRASPHPLRVVAELADHAPHQVGFWRATG